MNILKKKKIQFYLENFKESYVHKQNKKIDFAIFLW